MLKRNALEACLLLLTGMAVGATVAVLFAPESGAKTRKRLGKYARRTAEDLWEQGHEAMKQCNDPLTYFHQPPVLLVVIS